VDPDGSARIVANNLATANGIVILPDRQTLITGETHANCLTAFDIERDGRLSNRRIFASLPDSPDGICLDAEGAVWVAVPHRGEVLRVREGGDITHKVVVGDYAAACMLGGVNRTTLFICSATLETVQGATVGGGCIRAVEVDVCGTGWP
jgi:sugar lactone lactonase YvrE